MVWFITEVSFYDWLKLFLQYLNEKVRPYNLKEEHLLILDYAVTTTSFFMHFLRTLLTIRNRSKWDCSAH